MTVFLLIFAAVLALAAIEALWGLVEGPERREAWNRHHGRARR